MQSHPRNKKRQDGRLRIFSKGSVLCFVMPAAAAKLLTRSVRYFPLFFDFSLYEDMQRLDNSAEILYGESVH